MPGKERSLICTVLYYRVIALIHDLDNLKEPHCSLFIHSFVFYVLPKH